MTNDTRWDNPVASQTRNGWAARPSIRNISHSSLISVILRCANLACSLAALRLATSYFGIDRFAVWATIFSLEALLTFADLGLGNALISIIAGANDESSQERARRGLSCAIWATSGISIILALPVSLGYSFGLLGTVVGANDAALMAETNLAMYTFLLGLLIVAPLSVFEKVQMALHGAHVAAAWRAAMAAIQLAVLLLAVSMESSMPMCVLCYSSVAVFLAAARALNVMKQYPAVRPTLAKVSLSGLWTILRSGFQFLSMQGAMAVVAASDQVILLRTAGAIEAATYAVPARALLALPALMAFALLPVWPAYAAASAQGDTRWISRTSRLILVAVIGISAPLTAGVQLTGPALLRDWVPGVPTAGRALLLGLSIWAVALVCGTAVGMLLAGLNRLLPLAICSVATAVICLPLKICMANVFGATGVAWANVVAYGCCTLVPYAILVPRYLGQTKGTLIVQGRLKRGAEW